MRLRGLAALLALTACGWLSAAVNDGRHSLAAASAAEYVYLHQTSGGFGIQHGITDRSPLQCVAD